MNNISNIEINGTTYSIKDAEAREALKNITIDESIIDEKLNNFLSVENGTGTLSLQTKEWVGDEDEEPRKSLAEGLGDVSLGLGCYTDGKASVALGKLTSAPVSYATALGLRTTALGNRSTIMGFSGISAFLDAGITENSTTEEIIASWLSNKQVFSLAKGPTSCVQGENSLALGIRTFANGYQCVAVGDESKATGNGTTALAQRTWANGAGSKSVFNVLPLINTSTDKEEIYNAWLANKFNLAFAIGSLTYGHNSLALGKYTAVFGFNNVAKGDYASVFGNENIVVEGSFSAGSNNQILGQYSAGFGLNNKINNSSTLVSGKNNTVEGVGANVFGCNNKLTGGSGSTIIGLRNTVSGIQSNVIGVDNVLTNSYCGVLGFQNEISGEASYVLGSLHKVNASFAHVLGRGLIVNTPGTYLGKFNKDISDSNLRFVLGKGTSDTARANLMEYRETKDTLDIYATDVKFTKPDGTIVSVYDLLDRINTLENIINAQ